MTSVHELALRCFPPGNFYAVFMQQRCTFDCGMLYLVCYSEGMYSRGIDQ